MSNLKTGQYRIIAGQWRGRKLAIPNHIAVRPSPDRIRETLFNWLATSIVGTHCLDAFAGSGALGFEALSRGATYVCFIDKEQAILQQLKQHAVKLDCQTQTTILQHDWSSAKLALKERFDIIFLDPPFRQNSIHGLLKQLQQSTLLKPHTWIYIEAEKEYDLSMHIDLSFWHIYRHRQAGQMAYYLLQAQTMIKSC